MSQCHDNLKTGDVTVSVWRDKDERANTITDAQLDLRCCLKPDKVNQRECTHMMISRRLMPLQTELNRLSNNCRWFMVQHRLTHDPCDLSNYNDHLTHDLLIHFLAWLLLTCNVFSNASRNSIFFTNSWLLIGSICKVNSWLLSAMVSSVTVCCPMFMQDERLDCAVFYVPTNTV